MKVVQKRMIAAGCIGVLVIGGAVVVSRHSTYEQKENETENGTETASVSRVVKQPADLLFWYSDKSYQKFFEKAAEEYYEDTGIVVDVEYQDSMDYMDAVYTATMQGETFPDIYMIGSDELEEAYLYGLAAENTASDIYESTVASNAVTASTYKEKMYAYPLSYNTCLFVYKNGYFETEPETLQAIIDYSIDNEPPENVQYLLEWDVNDAFYDFPFISNSVSFVKDEVETMQVNYDEDLYNEGNTMKNLPTEALYLSLSLQDHRSMDKWYLPSLSWLPAETLRYRSACSCLPPAEAVEAHSHPMAHNHTSRSVRSESAHPSNADGRIPSLLIYNLSLPDQFLFLPGISHIQSQYLLHIIIQNIKSSL